MEETKETQESLQRKREQALQRLHRERTEEALWDCVTAYQDFEFHTINEQITKIAQNHPAIVKTSSSEAPCWISR